MFLLNVQVISIKKKHPNPCELPDMKCFFRSIFHTLPKQESIPEAAQ